MKNQKFKGETLTEKRCINSILRFYNESSLSEVKQGMSWYNDANQYCKELATRFNISLQQSAGIIAAFSPQTGWNENKRFALSFLYTPNIRIKSLIQTLKAKKILTLQSESDIYKALSVSDRALKTKNFFLNIINPDIAIGSTIDRHAIGCCIQRPDNVFPLNNNYGHLTNKQYLFFETCYIKAAYKIGILPHQLQAITWIIYRRIRELRAHTNESHWKPFINENPF